MRWTHPEPRTWRGEDMRGFSAVLHPTVTLKVDHEFGPDEHYYAQVRRREGALVWQEPERTLAQAKTVAARATENFAGRYRTRGGLVKIARLPNGKWRGTVIDEQGKPVEYQDFTTLAAAQRWKRDEMKETHVGSGRGRRRAAPLHHHGHGVG